MTSTVTYQGDLRTECKHTNSGDTFITDAPLDNRGKGEGFSPTDTLATSLASCMLTIMGIKAEQKAIDLNGSHAEVIKHMQETPRKINKIEVTLFLPKSTDEKNRTILEHAALTCPVHQSLDPAMEKVVNFKWEM